jgi:hypothetical protein
MGKLIYDMSMSLDGFVTASNRTPEEPMGDGGLRMVEWEVRQRRQRGRRALDL